MLGVTLGDTLPGPWWPHPSQCPEQDARGAARALKSKQEFLISPPCGNALIKAAPCRYLIPAIFAASEPKSLLASEERPELAKAPASPVPPLGKHPGGHRHGQVPFCFSHLKENEMLKGKLKNAEFWGPWGCAELPQLIPRCRRWVLARGRAAPAPCLAGGGYLTSPHPAQHPKSVSCSWGTSAPNGATGGTWLWCSPPQQAPEHRAGHFGRGDAALPQ